MGDLQNPIIPQTQNLAEPFLKGYAMMASIAARKQEADRQAALDLKRIALQDNANALRANHYSDMADLAQGKLAVTEEALRYKQQQDYDTTSAEQQMIQEMSKIKAPIGTNAYDSQRLEIMSRYPQALRGVQGRKFLFDTAQDHVKQLKVQQGLFNAELDKLGVPYDAFENPQIWKQRDDGKRFLELPAQTKNGVPITDEKGKQKTSFVTINNDTFDKLNGKYKDLFSNSPPPPVNGPAKIKVVSPDGTAGFIPQERLQDYLDAGYTQ